MAVYKIKFDKNRCITCMACLVHCKVKNKVPEGLSLNVLSTEGFYADEDGIPRIKNKYRPCLMCKKPECVPACPEGAMVMREEDGLVYIIEEKCTGCGECIAACPWDVPVINPETGKAMKCDYCKDRIEQGLDPACVTGCTGKALSFKRP